MAMTEEQFRALNPEDRKKVLGQMRLEKEFKALPSDDRKQINTLLKANKDEKMSEAEAIARGGAQGFTFGFADELAAGLSAAGQKFLGNSDFQPAFDKALKEQRDRDKLANAKFPKLFTASEVGGAVGVSFVPVVGVAGKSAQAAKGLATATKGLTKAKRSAEQVKKAFELKRINLAQPKSVIEAIKGVEKAKAVQAAAPIVGKGIARGATGVGKAAIGGAATGIGKAEDKTIESAKEGALIGGVTGLGASVLGPVLRGLAKTTIKSPAITSAIASGGKSEALKVVFNKLKKDVSTNQAVKMRIDGINKALKAPKSKLTKAGEKFLDTLGEAFEKQGGAGLVTTHLSLLKDPSYSEFLDSVEKQRGLTVPKEKN
ncbi:MAG: hypothetical protein ACYTAF_12440 [Planctomycetota bacterium]|jgi:hypothetical protein